MYDVYGTNTYTLVHVHVHVQYMYVPTMYTCVPQ